MRKTGLIGEKSSLFLQKLQVINNLVSNAIYAQKSTGGDIFIEFDTVKDNLQIRVRDRGCGVPPEIKDKLFKQMITSKGAQGTGLGVYISSSVIKGKFFGDMWFENNPGGGSVFIISIPLEYVTLIDKDGTVNKNAQK